MVRLSPYDNSPKGGDGPNAHVFDQFLGLSSADNRKRSRPASSLDYTPPSATNLVTPPRRGQKQETHTQQQQQEQEQEQSYPSRFASRARGSSGIPPSKLELSDLEGMSEDQLRQALMEDPELAAALAEETSKRTGRGKKRGQYYRGPDGRMMKEGADRLDMLKDQGFPFAQWTVLLLLLGVGFYQLYKVLAGPSKSSGKKGTDKGTARGKGAKGGKGKKAKPKQQQKKVAEDVVVEQVVAEIEGIDKDELKILAKKQPPKKKQRKPKIAAKQPVAAASKEEVESTPVASPISVAAEAAPSPVLQDGDRDATRTETVTAPIHAQTAVVAEEDDAGWQTVGGNTARAKAAPVETEMPQAKEDGAEKEEATPEVVAEKNGPKPEAEQPATQPPATKPLSKKKTKKKKNGKQEEPAKDSASVTVEEQPKQNGSAEPDLTEEAAEKEGAPSSTEEATEKEGAPSSTEEATEKEGVPSSTEEAAQKEGAPSSTEEAAEKEGAPSSTEEAAEKEGAPSSTEEAAEKEGAPSSTEEATEKGAPSSTEEATQKEGAPSSTEDDAALARQLQKEEDNLATEEQPEEVWEEVSSKKKRPK